jgi:hypothetical protein
MKRGLTKLSRKAQFESLRVHLSPVQSQSDESQSRREIIQHLISSMVLASKKRGRPKIESKTEVKRAA